MAQELLHRPQNFEASAPLEDLPSCGDAGSVNVPHQLSYKFSNLSRKINKPPAIQPLVFKVGRTFRQQLIRLEKQTSTHYKNRVHEISDYNNRSRGAVRVIQPLFAINS